ncbi:DUF4365 domain-containing protein [Patescibacteria group bacterium]
MSRKYIRAQQLGNKGEAFFESLLSEKSLVHKIDRSKDIGFDFLCEWVSGERPSRLLFGVQVKTRSRIREIEGGISRLNGLSQFKIRTDVQVSKDTREYWKGFDFPIFMFLIHFGRSAANVYYKRYTPVLHNTAKEGEEYFYKVNNGNKFLAIIQRDDSRSGGFCRDLYIDHLRCQYNKGMLSGIDPRDLGLEGYRKGDIFSDIVSKYREKITQTLREYESFGGW